MQNTLQQISIYGRLLGAVFYYELMMHDLLIFDILSPTKLDARMGNFIDVKHIKKSPHLLKRGLQTKYH